MIAMARARVHWREGRSREGVGIGGGVGLGNGVSSVEKGVVGDVAGMGHDEVMVRNKG